MVEKPRAKGRTQRFIDKFEQYYAVGVIVFTALVAAVPVLFMGQAFNAAFYTAMTVMVAAVALRHRHQHPGYCAVSHWQQRAARRTVQGRHPRGECGHGQVLAFDKTGTLTAGKPEVTTACDE